MRNATPTTPSFVFGYWRPWKENSNLFDSYLDYSRDISLAKYGADTVGQYINQASKAQIEAINDLGESIGRGMNVLSNQISDINETLVFLNRNMDIQIEQQKLSNLLLQNIAQLLRVPDSEKERQHSIELGIKFFVNASKDADLYADALEELFKAESLMKQDYFVLHRIGCIYLYVEKYINPEKALEYFLRAAKYASVETDRKAIHLANVLTNNFNTVNSGLNKSEKQIGLLAAESYEKSAFAAYILGRFSDAVNYQSKALKFNEVPQNRFLLAKYQVRYGEISEGVRNLSQCIDDEPVFAVASFKEIDLINEPEVIKLISSKNKSIDGGIIKLIDKWKCLGSCEARKVIEDLSQLRLKSYEEKVSKFQFYEKKAIEITEKISDSISMIDSLISVITNSAFCSIDANSAKALIDELLNAKDLPLEELSIVLKRISSQVDTDKLEIGTKHAGGIVFYIDSSGKHGLVCADIDFGKARWGFGKIGESRDGIANDNGLKNTKDIVDKLSSSRFLFSKKPMLTAARLCYESRYNGFSDWYLPTREELQLMLERLTNNGIENFSLVYWSSSEIDDEAAHQIVNGKLGGHRGRIGDMRWEKHFPSSVRAVRKF